MSIRRELNPNPRAVADRAAILENPGFGKYFTDHMVRIDWDETNGWHDARLLPYGPIAIDPATNVLHYGQAIFEGLKAYRHADGSIVTFRPHMNAARFKRSARRLAMAEVPDELFVGSIEALVRHVASAWGKQNIRANAVAPGFVMTPQIQASLPAPTTASAS